MEQARLALAGLLPGVSFTEAIWTEPEGGSAAAPAVSGLPAAHPAPSVLSGVPAEPAVSPAPSYLNQLAIAHTPLTADELTQHLKALERSLGRTPEMRSRGIVPIDLDLLLFNHRRYHERDWQRSYVKRLMEDKLPEKADF